MTTEQITSTISLLMETTGDHEDVSRTYLRALFSQYSKQTPPRPEDRKSASSSADSRTKLNWR